MYRISINSYPNREIRVNLVPEKPPKKENYIEERSGYDFDKGRVDRTLSLDQNSKGYNDIQNLQGKERPLPPGQGGLPRAQEFSTYGRRQILRAGGALERKYRHEDCLFLTLTLPGSTNRAYRALASWSGYLVNAIKAWIAWRIPQKMDMYVWELQKRGALHLHYVVACPDRVIGEYIRDNLQEEWNRLLERVSEMSGVDLYESSKGFTWRNRKEVVKVDAQWCEKSVAAYLSKYVSKQSKRNSNVTSKAFGPSRWYGVSRPLNALLKSLTNTFVLTGQAMATAYRIYNDVIHITESMSIKSYSYKNKVVEGLTNVSYIEQDEQEAVWQSLVQQITTEVGLFMTIEQNLIRQINNGVILMRKTYAWRKTFESLSGKHVDGLVTKSLSSQHMTELDSQFLLDTLVYTFRYCQRTSSELPGACQLWYQQTSTLMRTLQAQGVEWVKNLVM